MKTGKVIFIIGFTAMCLGSCIRVTDLTGSDVVTPLVDSGLTTPSFSTSSYNTLANPNQYVLVNGSAEVRLFYCSYNKIYTAKLSGSTFAGEIQLYSNLYAYNSIDAIYDQPTNRYLIGYGYTTGGWPPAGTVGYEVWNGSMIDAGYIENTASKQVAIVKGGEDYYFYFTNDPAERVYHKKISMLGASVTVTPSYQFSTFNSILDHTNDFSDEDIEQFRGASNLISQSGLLGWSHGDNGKNNFELVNPSYSNLAVPTVQKLNNSEASSFAVSPLNSGFLIAYESNMDIALQNQGEYDFAGEHIRLKLVSENSSVIEPNLGGVNNPDYVEAESSIALPLPFTTTTQVTAISLAANTNNTEAGLAFIKDNLLYFTLISYGDKLRASPITQIASGINSTYMKSVYFNNKYYIVLKTGADLTMYISN